MLVEEKVLQYNLHKQMIEMYKKAAAGERFTSENKQTYERIESTMQRIIAGADNKCRKARRGTVLYSPYQKQLMGSILILRQIKLRHLLKGQSNRPRSRRLKRLIKKYAYTGPTKFHNTKDIQKAIEEATNKYDKFKPSAYDQRYAYLEKLARDHDTNDGKGIRHHFKILKHREQVKEYFRRIRTSEGKNKRVGVNKIQIDYNGSPTITYDKEIIEKEIMRVNSIKLLQANDTPLRSNQLTELLGEQGDFQKWEQILRGAIDLPEEIDESLKLWYAYITSTEKHEATDFAWTTEEYFESWKKIKEDKTTLPGIQVANIKCIKPKSKAADVISLLALIPFMVGYSPETWRTGIDSMIPKKTADLRPEKLRLILLLDARFNHGNKLIGKKMMEYGEKHNLLAHEQFGSRKAKSATDHAINKRFTLDIIRQSGTNAIYIANDAKSCYDRIILMVAYLTMRNFGIPSLAAQSTISSIMNMKHYVRTTYGDSSDYYGGDKWVTKPHGCGQGNGYGPALWACISSPLLHVLHQQGYGSIVYQPIDHKKLHLSAFAFVDDTDIIQTQNTTSALTLSSSYNDIAALFNLTQSALDMWSGSLRATGGELEDSKTYYVPIIQTQKGTTKALKSKCENLHLTLAGHNGTRTNLVAKNPNDSFFLGIWQSPSGDESVQLEHMMSQIKSWGSKTTKNSITWRHARIAVKSTIGRTLVYPLPATTFDSKQCKALQTIFLYETLGKIGIVRTAPSLVATAPVSLGGLGLLSFEMEQLVFIT